MPFHGYKFQQLGFLVVVVHCGIEEIAAAILASSFPLLISGMDDVILDAGVVPDPTQIDVKLFNRWSFDDVQVNDISLADYIGVVASKHATYVPHTAGRYSVKRFRKAQCPIVERLTNSLMMHGRNNGKKLMAVRIIKHAMEIIHLLTDQNPIQVIVDAVINRYGFCIYGLRVDDDDDDYAFYRLA
ncbi:40S ribosomal protein S5 [Spatholobus suberectus]|nr:40S ribosomal protein S5 [Spatholobus suberectus]